MLVQLVVIATNQIIKFKNLMWWAIFLKRKLKKKSLVVEYLNLLKPVVSVLRQSAGFFLKSLRLTDLRNGLVASDSSTLKL